MRVNFLKAAINAGVGVGDAVMEGYKPEWTIWLEGGVAALGYALVAMDKMPDIGDALAQSGTTLLGRALAKKVGIAGRVGGGVRTIRAGDVNVRASFGAPSYSPLAAKESLGRYPAPEYKEAAPSFPRLD